MTDIETPDAPAAPATTKPDDDDDGEDREAPKDLANARIKVKGRIHLGHGLDLVQQPVVAPAPAFRFSVGRPDDGSIPAIDDPNVMTAPGRLPTQELEYALAKSDREVDIEDDGLTVTEAQRAELRDQWRTEFGPAFAQMAPPPASPVPAEAPPGPSTGAEASGDRSLGEMIKDLHEMERREEEELMKTDPALAIQKRMQNNAANAQLMSNMMSMSHQTSMAIIGNMTS